MHTGTAIVGGGIGSLRTAEALRSNGYSEPICIVSDEAHPPYDRPALSKSVLVGDRAPMDTFYRTPQYFDELGVHMLTGVRATGVDIAQKRLETAEGPIAFDKLVIATGARVRSLPQLPELEGIHVLRTLGDAARLRHDLLGGPKVVIIGAGFIGCEVASSAAELGLDVTMLEAGPSVLSRVLGDHAGRTVMRMHQENGTSVRCGRSVAHFEGEGRVERVRCFDGTVVDADVVVIGIGVVPNAEWLANSGIRIDGGVICDESLHAGHPDIYAIGDVASWPNMLADSRMRCEQWTNAVDQARHVARSIAGTADSARPFLGSGYFWSDQCGTKIQSVGTTIGESAISLIDEPEARHLVVAYRRAGRIVGAVTIGDPRAIMRLKGLVERRATWQAVHDSFGEGVTGAPTSP